MENYKAILELVEEVRDILSLHEAGDEAGGDKVVMGKFKTGTLHNPFKYLKKGKSLGPAVRGDPAHPGKKRGYWKCRCHSYKCICKGSEGERKVVRIKKAWKGTYNTQYRKWRKRHANKYLPSKGAKWKARPKKKAAKPETP